MNSQLIEELYLHKRRAIAQKASAMEFFDDLKHSVGREENIRTDLPQFRTGVKLFTVVRRRCEDSIDQHIEADSRSFTLLQCDQGLLIYAIVKCGKPFVVQEMESRETIMLSPA